MKLKRQKMNKAPFIVLILLASGFGARAQYYFNDIVTNKRVMDDLVKLKEEKIRAVKVTSLESDGSESEGFVCRKNINRSYTSMEIYTQTSNSYASFFTSFFNKEGILEKTTDSSEVSVTTVSYTYDDKGRLGRIYSYTDFAGDDYADDVSEEHLYHYNENGMPSQMVLVKNLKDTTTIIFMPDENKNVAIEKNSRTAEIYYYYYDSRGRVTDIVHSYGLNQKMIPDFRFEYNNAGQVTKMVASEKEGADYFTWRYNYENGLRTGERCYSREGKLIGSVEYENK